MTLTYFRSAILALAVIGLLFRFDVLLTVVADDISARGDMLEYQRYAEHLLEARIVPPPDRMPGLPLLLAVLFGGLPFDHDWTQRATTVALGVGLIPLVAVLGRRVYSSVAGLIAAAFVAVNPFMVANAAKGLTEELFLLAFLIHLLVYATVCREGGSWPAYCALGLTAGLAALVRFDSVQAFLPLAVALGVRQVQTDGRRGILKLIPLPSLPLVMLVLARAYTDAHGFQDIMWRTGNRFFWQENLRGRMPYHYMFYAPITMRDWLFHYHDLGGLVAMVAKGVAHTILAVSYTLGGVLALAFSLYGVRVLVRSRGDWGMPLAALLVLAPQFAFGQIHMPGDMFRYIVRDLPLLALLFALGCCAGVHLLTSITDFRWLRHHFLGPGLIALVAVSPSLLPGSVYGALSDNVSSARWLDIPDVQAELVATWEATLAGGDVEGTARVVDELLERRPGYAPTHFVAALVDMKLADLPAAITHLENALALVPAFAEAAAWLAELYALEGQLGKAETVIDNALALRPDFAPLALIRGQLAAFQDEPLLALDFYRSYGRQNQALHKVAYDMMQRVHARKASQGEAVVDNPEYEAALVAFESYRSAGKLELSTEYLWVFRQQGLGIVVDQPHDVELFANTGTLYLQQKNLDQGIHWLERSLKVTPTHLRSLHILATALTLKGQTGRALDLLRQATELAPDSIPVLQTQLVVELSTGRSAGAQTTRD